ncbi:MAG: hypothetical protein FWD88_02535 [Treponema sp.]|nr:hypothetical protein [Treponema sp.]
MVARRVVAVVMFVSLFLVFGGCSAQAQSANNEQRIVGTWTNLHSGETVVFNANGTFTGWSELEHYQNWAAAGDRIAFFRASSSEAWTVNFRISSDGRTLIMFEDNRAWGVVLRRN